ncbi:MAG TPA: NAD(P)-dependent oxidoreductase, partial [Steroidobacteraceae bacterium]|nr:NAD(P)-dependent oxidoreductase [Steroidobacteraceae bacterium]
VGFIGLGKMGGAIAIRMTGNVKTLTVFDTQPAAIDRLVAKGASPATSVAAVAASSEIVFLSLPSPLIVRDVARELPRDAATRTVVDLSTTGPQIADEIAQILAARGLGLIDAPVSGGLAGAVNGTLAVMAAGAPGVFEKCRPLLATIGKVFFVGDRPGLGQTMKLCNNLLSAAVLALSSEAVVMGVKAGLDPKVMLDVINAGSGRNSATQDKFPRSVLPRTFDFGFSTGLMYKDVKLCMEEAERLGVPMWVGPAVRQIWMHACHELGADSDFTAIVKCIERLAKIEVRG